MKNNTLFTWALEFSFTHKENKTKRMGITTVLAETQAQGCVDFHDMIKKDKVWKPYDVIVESCKLSAVNKEVPGDEEN